MKRFVALLCMSLLTLLGACGKSPTPNDVVGTWVNPDGATLTLNADGQFMAQSLPRKIFWWQDQAGPPLDIKGAWSLTKGKPHWEIKLRFGEALGRPLGKEITVLVSGSGTSTYLYGWMDEPGGNRYKLEKKPAAAQK